MCEVKDWIEMVAGVLTSIGTIYAIYQGVKARREATAAQKESDRLKIISDIDREFEMTLFNEGAMVDPYTKAKQIQMSEKEILYKVAQLALKRGKRSDGGSIDAENAYHIADKMLNHARITYEKQKGKL
jgi:hypothetical protein